MILQQNGTVKLKTLAIVQMGYSFRSRLESSLGGGVAVIQMKNLLENSTVNCDNLVKTDMEAAKHHLVQKGDLVFRSRGLVSTAAILLKDPGKAVVAAPLLTIRVTELDRILPEYLNWYIGQRDAQVYFTSMAEGTLQRMISKQTLEEMEIVLPSMERQQKIVELALLSAREHTLLNALANKRNQYIATVLMQFAKGIHHE